MNFCRRCGAKLDRQPSGVFVCTNGHTLFINAAPATGIFFVTDNHNVLLSVRGIEPYKGMLDAIGGFVEEHESLEESIAREIEEELGLTPDQYDSPQFLCSSPAIYPYDGEDRTILGSLFWSRLKTGAQPVANDDVARIEYVPLYEIDLSKIGNADVKVGIKKLQDLFIK